MLLDNWTIEQVIARAGGTKLNDRIRSLSEALCAVTGEVLSDAELDIPVPSLLLSNDQLLINEPTTVRALIEGLADNELPGHTAQLLALIPVDSGSGRGQPSTGRSVRLDKPGSVPGRVV